MVPKKNGSWRLFLNVTSGFNLEGGHDELHGLDANGNLIDVPLHRHAVSLDFTRIETEVQHTLADGWDVWLRVPYDIKDQSVSIELVDPATQAEQEAMERNSFIHHRDDTYRGISDLKLLGAHWRSSAFRSGDAFELALGTSIPVGKTEPDPIMAGDAGEEHLHIQFGSGTFDPLLELYYATAVSSGIVLRGFGLGRFPFYQNDKTYRGPIEVSSGLSIEQHDVFATISLRAVYSFFYQGYAYWDGERDPNTGLLSNSVVLGATSDVGWRTSLGVAVRYPFAQRTLSSEGDTFEQGPTFLLTIMRSIGGRE